MTTYHHLASPFPIEATLNHCCRPVAPPQEISPPNSDSSLTPAIRIPVKIDLPSFYLDDDLMTPPEEEEEKGRGAIFAPSVTTATAAITKMTTTTVTTTKATTTATTTTTTANAAVATTTTTSPPSKPKRARVRFNLPDQVETGSSESEPEPYPMWNSSDNDDGSARTVSPDSEVSSLSSSSLDIRGQRVSTELLVSLLDRSSEMQDLVERNQAKFAPIKGFLSRASGKWEEFLKLLYVSREAVGDREWLESIQGYIGSCPPYFEQFKQIVGYDDSRDQDDYDYEDDEDDELSSSDEDDDEDYDDDDDDRYSDTTYDDVDLTPIRRLPSRLATFERSYPQFFVNARTSLCASRSNPPLRRGSVADPEATVDTVMSGGRAESRFDEFVRILYTPRRAMTDDAWELALLKCLKGWPNLLANLKEIVAYEIEAGWENGELEDEDEDENEEDEGEMS